MFTKQLHFNMAASTYLQEMLRVLAYVCATVCKTLRVEVKIKVSWVQARDELSDGGDFEEPVEAGLFGCVIHVIHRERV